MSHAMRRRETPSATVTRLAIVAVLLLAACSAPPRPVVAPPVARGHTPVIFLPGITGTELVDMKTGRAVWGDTRGFFFPRDDGYAIALPIVHPERNAIEAGEPILDVPVLGWHKEVYAPFVRFMSRHGYLRGDLRHPAPDADFFMFAYDWRLSSVVNARRLSEDLERLRVARGEKTLVVDLVAQSGAALIARYFIKYGGGELDEAAAGRARPPDNVRVARLVLVGTSNGGAIRILREMNRGRRYVRLVGRYFSPEVFFTFPSLYEDLPVYRRDLFVDTNGEPLAIDLFDAGAWKTHEWSIFGAEAARRASKRPDMFGRDERARMEFLRSRLHEAQQLHELLARDVSWFGATRYDSIQNLLDPTPARAVLVRTAGGWTTLFAGDREVDRDPWLRSLAVAPGDGHATLQSQRWLSPQERNALEHETTYVEGGHFGIMLNPATFRRILERLKAPPTPDTLPTPRSGHSSVSSATAGACS